MVSFIQAIVLQMTWSFLILMHMTFMHLPALFGRPVFHRGPSCPREKSDSKFVHQLFSETLNIQKPQSLLQSREKRLVTMICVTNCFQLRLPLFLPQVNKNPQHHRCTDSARLQEPVSGCYVTGLH